jgi:glycosyltransferase involved in cell wall biosynthesis
MNASKRHVLAVSITGSTKGGAEGVLCQIIHYFQERGFHLHVVFLSKKQGNEWIKSHDEGYTYYYFSIKTLFAIARIKFDYIFTSHMRTTCIVGLLRKIKLLKSAYCIGREPHSLSSEKKGIRKMIRMLYRKSGYSAIDLLICQTEEMKRAFLSFNATLNIPVVVIRNPVDMNMINEKEKEEFYPPTTEPYIITAGRFISEKGFDILIVAFFKLKQECQELKLVILGDGKLRPEIERLIKELSLEDDIILYGIADNVYPFFKNARMCVVSSRIEGFPNVLLQMMSQNEKVVSTLCAGDIDKIDGLFTCRPGVEQDLGRAMRQCLEADTTGNRVLFDKELQGRSIDGFMDKVISYLDYNEDANAWL